MKPLLRIFATVLLVLSIWDVGYVVSVSYAQLTLTGAGKGAVGGGASCTTSTFALDGTPVQKNSSGASTLTSNAFSTTYCSDLVIVTVTTNGGPVLTVTDTQSHLTFAKRASVQGSGSYSEEWYAVLSSAALSGDTITVTTTSSAYMSTQVYAVSGYKTATPFDTNVAIPGTAGNGSGLVCSWTTSNANDMLIGNGVTANTTADTSFTAIGSNPGFLLSEYQVVSSTQSALFSVQLGVTSSVCDAIQKGP